MRREDRPDSGELKIAQRLLRSTDVDDQKRLKQRDLLVVARGLSEGRRDAFRKAQPPSTGCATGSCRRPTSVGSAAPVHHRACP